MPIVSARKRAGAALELLTLATSAAFAQQASLSQQQTVSVGGSSVVLLRPQAPRASVILMPGGDGYIGAQSDGTITRLKGNQLVRRRMAYYSRRLAVLVVDAGTDLSAALQYMAAIKRPVTVIGTSCGTLRAAYGVARGARPGALVLTSGCLALNRDPARMSPRSSARPQRCRAPSSLSIARMAAASPSPLASIPSSAALAAAPVPSGSPAA